METENKQKFFVASEQPETEKQSNGNLLHDILDFFAHHYIVVNRIFAIVHLCLAIVALLASLMIAPLINLASLFTAGEPELRFILHLGRFSGLTLGVSIISTLISILIVIYVLKTARFADKQAVLLILLVLAIIFGYSFITIILLILSLGSKMAALYIYRNRSLEEQFYAIVDEFKGWLKATQK